VPLTGLSRHHGGPADGMNLLRSAVALRGSLLSARGRRPAWVCCVGATPRLGEEVGSAASARLGDEDPPYVLFICQDQEQRDLFMTAADHELTGYRWHATAPDQHRYLGRQRVLFATEIDIHQDRLEARRLAPNRPAEADNSRPDTEIRGVKLPGPLTDAQGETQQPSEQAVDPAKSADTTPGREAA
jgi:hypothetical protein